MSKLQFPKVHQKRRRFQDGQSTKFLVKLWILVENAFQGLWQYWIRLKTKPRYRVVLFALTLLARGLTQNSSGSAMSLKSS